MSRLPAQRILVALHPGDDPENALFCAAAVAAELKAELAGLFLEDQALFDLAELAVVEVSRATGSARLLDAAVLERELRSGADAARRSISRHAAERRVVWSFEVRRGRARDTVMEAMRSARLTIVSRGAFNPQGVPLPARTRGPVVVLLEQGAGEAATLELALGAARRIAAPLVALLAGTRTRAELAEIEELGARAGVPLSLRTAPVEPGGAAAEIAASGARLLVLDAGGAAAAGGELSRYLAAARCDAMLVAAS